MHTNSLLHSRELESLAGKFECMPEMVALHASASFKPYIRKQARSDLMTDNAGSPESSRTYCLRNTFGALIYMAACNLVFASAIYESKTFLLSV